MSSDEDVPAPSPSAAVLARRASRKVKPMREESGSDEDAQEPEDWADDDEASSEEDESDEEVRVSNAQRGRVRLHYVSQKEKQRKEKRGDHTPLSLVTTRDSGVRGIRGGGDDALMDAILQFVARFAREHGGAGASPPPTDFFWPW